MEHLTIQGRSVADSGMKKVLLLGSTGQVGFELQRSLVLIGKLITPQRSEVDLTDPDVLYKYLGAIRPDIIVNAAAWTAVDKAEDYPEEVHAINAVLPEILARYASEQGIWLVHYSTDYVYSGAGQRPWKEDDPTKPLSVYGQTKLEGDEAIQCSGANYLIFRTSWVYSARSNNFMNTMLRLGMERDFLKVVCDQVGAPTPARLIAEVTLVALQEQNKKLTLTSGTYHLATRGETSWYGFAQAVFELATLNGTALSIKPDNVQGITTSQWPTAAVRPLNSRLSLERIEKGLGICLPHWKLQLALTMAERNAELYPSDWGNRLI